MDCDHSNIISGEINDTSVTTINNVKIGMSIESFLKFHFESYPKTIEDILKQ